MLRHTFFSAVMGSAFAVTAVNVSAQEATCAAPVSYRVTELAGLGGPLTRAVAIDDQGQAVLLAMDSTWTLRVVMRGNGEARTMAHGSGAGAQGMSSDGQVAGWENTARGLQGAIWSGSTVRWLPALSGHRASLAADVNRDGVAVGWSVDSIGDAVAVMWRDGRLRRLDAGPSRPATSLALSINDAGVAVGVGDYGRAPYRRALRWDATGMRVLPGLGGGSDTTAAISGNGTIAGASLHPRTWKYHAVLWENGGVRDLGLLAGTHTTAAYGVNNCGAAVGESMVDVGSNRTVAVVWQPRRGTQDLNKLVPSGSGWDLHTARAVNSRGEIVGYGFKAGAYGERSFLLTPVF